tara:strand:+ start:599 stop:1861 length:1263 start_codon:yes stop_codon:yes gene_type:complete
MIDVIGTDAGAPASLPAAQQALIRAADHLAAPKRLQPALRHWLNSDQPELISSDDPRDLAANLEALPTTEAVVVLASGDPLWFGIGRSLSERLGGAQLRFHPAPTALQLAFARIGRPWQDASWVSLHGRDPAVLAPRLQQRPPALAVLTDPQQGGAETVRRILRSSGLEASYSIWLCENLGHNSERVLQLKRSDPLPENLASLLTVLLIAEPSAAPPQERLPLFGLEDGLFLQHADHPGLMTKREVRIQLLADLDLPKQGVLWDLGAGTGSVGLEALRLRPELKLMAVERRAGGAQLIEANAERLGVTAAAVLEREVGALITEGLPAGLERPDRVVLGGGGRSRAALLMQVLNLLQPGGVVLIPLATLEALAELRPLLEQQGMAVQISQLQAWRGQPLSDGTRLAPMNPTLILKGTKSHP